MISAELRKIRIYSRLHDKVSVVLICCVVAAVRRLRVKIGSFVGQAKANTCDTATSKMHAELLIESEFMWLNVTFLPVRD